MGKNIEYIFFSFKMNELSSCVYYIGYEKICTTTLEHMQLALGPIALDRPPYRPDLNPIEHMWKRSKKHGSK